MSLLKPLQERILAELAWLGGSPWLLPALALLALGGTVSAAVPVTAVVAPAAALVPRRWRAVVFAAAIGSAVGATLLLLAFHHLGWAQLHHAFPAMLESARWQEVIGWTRRWGVLALFIVAATPLPQTPALLVCALTQQPVPEVFVAMLAGKLIKYGVVGAMAARAASALLDVRRHGDRPAG